MIEYAALVALLEKLKAETADLPLEHVELTIQMGRIAIRKKDGALDAFIANTETKNVRLRLREWDGYHEMQARRALEK